MCQRYPHAVPELTKRALTRGEEEGEDRDGHEPIRGVGKSETLGECGEGYDEGRATALALAVRPLSIFEPHPSAGTHLLDDMSQWGCQSLHRRVVAMASRGVRQTVAKRPNSSG